MKTLLIISILTASPSFAALSIKPGLWTIETKMKRDGSEFDPQAAMKAAMAKMTPEQKKRMQEMMGKMGNGGGAAFNMNEKGMQFCYTGEMLKNEEFLNQHKDKDCTTTFPVKTSSKVVTEFKCKNGTEGRAEWNVKDSTHYNGLVSILDKKGTKSEINYIATFASSDCGNVKPIESFIGKKPVKK